MNPALIEKLQAVVLTAEAAGHGKKMAVYQQAADELGISVSTLQRKLKEVAMQKPRKRRSDAGATSIPVDELRIISGYLVNTVRGQGKRLASFERALEILRADGRVRAERVDEATGEVVPLSVSAVSRALTKHGLHPDQLARPTPKTQLASKHPNHVWQIDPSLCVLYYLPTKTGEALQVMSEKEFYKNKPANIRRIEKERVWRYVITDHASGWIYVHYVLGAESGQNLSDAFINAMQKRDAQDPVHGVPLTVMVDPGSANTGAVFKNLCRTLGVHVQVNQPGQPWAKGQVENANNIVERDFEHRMRFFENPPTSLEEINQYGWAWMRWYNATQKHSRTKDTRYNVWLKITAEQLRVAPPANVLRELAVSAPESRKVSAHLTVSYKGKSYDVSAVPGAAVGERVMLTRNPWRDDDSAQVVYTDSAGRTVIQVIEAQKIGEFGFVEDAAMIGDEFKARPDTHIDIERKNVERLVMNATTDEEAAKKRKQKAVPFGGSVDAMKPINDTVLPDYIRKRGTDLDVIAPRVELRNLSPVEAAKRLADRLGKQWKGAQHFTWLKQRYPDGVPEQELDRISARLAEPVTEDVATPLRLIKQ